MVIYGDIDGTICETQGIEYEHAKPIENSIRKVNAMYDGGNTIVYWTARGTVSGKDFGPLTERQLHEWGCKYHELRFGKPAFDLLIDDKARNADTL